MSMNLHVDAVRSVTVNKTGKASVQKISFGLWQTPTEVTRAILKSSSIKDAYIAWVKSISKDVTDNVYADDDIFQERDPIGTETYNPGTNHISDLEEWIVAAEKDGYEIDFYEM